MKKRFFAGIVFGVCLVLYVNFHPYSKTEQSTQEISMDYYRELKDSSAHFVLYIGRPSCRYCAVVSSYVLTIKNPPLPVYYISLEPFWGLEEYEIIKKELETDYLPCFKYISNGEIQYNLNNPLDYSYYDLDGTGRMRLYKQMEEKVTAFLNGAAGQSLPIDELPLMPEGAVTAVPVSPVDKEKNTHDR